MHRDSPQEVVAFSFQSSIKESSRPYMEAHRLSLIKHFLWVFLSCRSFSELYQKAIKDAECKPGEDQSGEAWVLDEREEEEEEKEEEEETAAGVSEADIMEVRTETEEVEGQPCDKGQSHGSLLTPPSLPLQRATSLQDQPANHSPEGSSSQLTRSCSLEQQPSFRDACDG